MFHINLKGHFMSVILNLQGNTCPEKCHNSVLEKSIQNAIQYNYKIQNFIQKICKPLFKFNLTIFEYSHFDETGAQFYLSTHPEWHEFYLKNYARSIFILNHLKRIISEKKQYHIWNTGFPIPENSDLFEFINARSQFSMWNDFTIYQHSKNSLESWSFATKEKNDVQLNFYLNNFRYLERFIMFFKQQFSDVIQDTSPARIAILNESFSLFNEASIQNSLCKTKNKEFLEEIQLKKIRLDTPKGPIYLSCREMQCLALRSRGKKAKEIARILKIDARTVEVYFRNIKQKSLNQPISLLLDIFSESPFRNLL